MLMNVLRDAEADDAAMTRCVADGTDGANPPTERAETRMTVAALDSFMFVYSTSCGYYGLRLLLVSG